MSRVLLAPLAVGSFALAFSGFAQPAMAAGAPTGSYQATCRVMQVDEQNMTLLASCQTIDGKTKLNRDWSYKYCIGDISNQNGSLSCSLDMVRKNADAAAAAAQTAQNAAAADNMAKLKAKTALIQAAKPAFNSAGTTALGRQAQLADSAIWYNDMEKLTGMGWNTADGIVFSEAFAYLKHRLGQPENAALRSEVINRVYQEVYGRNSTAAEQAKWDPQVRAKQAWYITMVSAEKQAMAGNPTVRSAMVARTIKQAFGRDMEKADQRQWAANSWTSGQIRNQMRTWLYSPAGASELVATVKRALGIKGRASDENAVKAAIAQFSTSKALYSEMIQ